jgi:hypothetical protein
MKKFKDGSAEAYDSFLGVISNETFGYSDFNFNNTKIKRKKRGCL